MKIKLYEYAPTRSQRCLWTLDELGLDYERVNGGPLIGTDEYKKVHPLGKLPAIEIDGRVLFESAAIATYLADQHPEKGLIAAPGTWERGLHDQWTLFALTEIEAWLWVNAKHTFIYPKEKRMPEIMAPNSAEASMGLGALDHALSDREYLVGDEFSVTDINVAYAANWGRLNGLTEDLEHLSAWLDRLFAREHCPLTKSRG